VSAAFADTFFFLALLRADDPGHGKAVAHVTLKSPTTRWPTFQPFLVVADVRITPDMRCGHHAVGSSPLLQAKHKVIEEIQTNKKWKVYNE
jgi:hypothetical protein